MYRYINLSNLNTRLIMRCLIVGFFFGLILLLDYINFSVLQPYINIMYVLVGLLAAVDILAVIPYLVFLIRSQEIIVHVHQNHYFSDLQKTYLMWDKDGEVSVAYADNINLIGEFNIDDENDIPNGKFVDYNFYLPNDIEQSQLSYETERSFKEYADIVLQLITTSPYDEDYYLKIKICPLLHRFEIIERVKR